MDLRLLKLNASIKGWINYFGIANAKRKLLELDKWIRRRLRACIWKQWKKIRTRYRNLVKLGIDNWKAWEYANIRKDHWKISGSPILSKSLHNKYPLNSSEPPYTERYVWWCERILNKIII